MFFISLDSKEISTIPCPYIMCDYLLIEVTKDDCNEFRLIKDDILSKK